jgi:hypothetical protein
MGLGPYPEISLSEARDKGRDARSLLAKGIDPIAQRDKERTQAWLVTAKNMNFKDVAEHLIEVKSGGPNPWWGEKRAGRARDLLKNQLEHLHKLPIDSAEAAEVLTLKFYEFLYAPVRGARRKNRDRIGPRWLIRPGAALAAKHFFYNVGKRAHALKVLPITVANPGGLPLDAILVDRQPKGGHLAAIPYNLCPKLYDELEELSQPNQDYFTISEAARAIGVTKGYCRNLVMYKKRIPVERAAPSLPAIMGRRGQYLHHYEIRIKPAELYARYPMVVDVIPGVKSVVFELIKFCILTGPRPSEAREMRWDQYNEAERLWIMRWEETKEGEHFERDMVIPLSEPANAIILKMKEIQRRYRMKTDYVFANYPSRFNTSAHIGEPPTGVAVLKNLHKVLKSLAPEQIGATMHGFRTNMRSWGDDQRLPNSTIRCFDEKDLERAIGHAAGFGTTKVSRNYSRQSSDVIPLVPIFDSWGEYITKKAKVIYDTPFRRQAAGE